MNNYITLGEVFHYTYCKRRWGLIFLNADWEDNYLTVEGKVMHENADNPFFVKNRKDIRVSNALYVKSEKHGFYGVCDSVAFIKSPNANFVEKLNGTYDINVVEYKHGKPNENDEIPLFDKMQLVGQMIAVEEMLGCAVAGFMFYREIRRRKQLTDFNEQKIEFLKRLEEIRALKKDCKIPLKERSVKCGNCSLVTKCLPKSKNISFKNLINSLKKEG